MSAFLTHFSLAAPLFVLVAIGYGLIRFGRWPFAVGDALTRFVFSLALPVLLFRMLSDLSHLPPVDARLLIAYFGGCLVVFGIGRAIARRMFGLDAVAQTVFALGGIFSNNVLLGVPFSRAVLGDAAMPSVALVLVFNALTLWTLATVSVEWARHGELSLRGVIATARSVLTNPIIVGILAGAGFGMTGLALPAAIDLPLAMIGQAAPPLALVALGMGLAQYQLGSGWRQSVAICILKLAVLPLLVLGLARLLGLPPVETRAVVLLSALSLGANVYLMARQFDSMVGTVASSLVLSTGLSALTVPLLLAAAG